MGILSWETGARDEVTVFVISTGSSLALQVCRTICEFSKYNSTKVCSISARVDFTFVFFGFDGFKSIKRLADRRSAEDIE